MPIRLEITGDDAGALVAEFRRLNELTTGDAIPNVEGLIRAMPLNDFITVANARLDPEGFMVAVKKEILDPPVSEEAAEALEAERAKDPKRTKKAKAAPEPEVVTEPLASKSNIEEFPAPRRSKAATMNAPASVESDEDPAADRQYVLDTLAGILKDPARKAEVLAFTGEQAKRHGTNKISELPVEPFPEIRREMEKAFPDARSA